MKLKPVDYPIVPRPDLTAPTTPVHAAVWRSRRSSSERSLPSDPDTHSPPPRIGGTDPVAARAIIYGGIEERRPISGGLHTRLQQVVQQPAGRCGEELLMTINDLPPELLSNPVLHEQLVSLASTLAGMGQVERCLVALLCRAADLEARPSANLVQVVVRGALRFGVGHQANILTAAARQILNHPSEAGRNEVASLIVLQFAAQPAMPRTPLGALLTAPSRLSPATLLDVADMALLLTARQPQKGDPDTLRAVCETVALLPPAAQSSIKRRVRHLEQQGVNDARRPPPRNWRSIAPHITVCIPFASSGGFRKSGAAGRAR